MTWSEEERARRAREYNEATRRMVDILGQSGYVSGPRRAANLLRSLAWSRWCPACRDGDHFNHAPRGAMTGTDPVPEDGGCWTLNRVGYDGRCRCLWRGEVPLA